MSASNIIGNRNSTPEASSANLRLPSQRSSAMIPGHQLRASADEGRGVRPASEVLYNQIRQSHLSANPDDSVDKATQRWIADIDQYENTLEEMAAATLDQDFKDELSAIEQWFRVLSEPERTAALYALLDQSSLLQTRFFIAVLQQKAKTHPPAGVLSPANFGDKDAMSTRLSTAMSKLSVDSNRNSVLGRPPPSPGNKRNSGLDQTEINNLFPDAVAAIATEKANLTQSTGAAPSSNRNSTATIDRSSFASPPTISAPGAEQKRESMSRAAPSSWGGHASTDNTQARPKSSSGQVPMGQFAQPLPSAGLRSPRGINMNNDGDTHTTTLNFPPTDPSNMSALFSPYNGSGNWASMVNTPMVGNFPNQGSNQSNMVADATAARLAALSTVNNRIELGDVPRNSRRSRSNDGQPPRSPGFPPTGMASIGGLLRDQNGQILSPQQAASLQAQQLASLNGRSRPSSPSLQVPDNHHGMNFTSPQNNGFLTAYNGANTLGMPTLAPSNSGYYDGYHSDVDNNQRGRSPRGRRGTSKPPEDPTDVELLKDIPAWLRSLRLHKYTDNLKDLDWKDLIQLDDAGLDNRGVGALGARRKMLKVFEQVREAQSIGKI